MLHLRQHTVVEPTIYETGICWGRTFMFSGRGSLREHHLFILNSETDIITCP